MISRRRSNLAGAALGAFLFFMAVLILLTFLAYCSLIAGYWDLLGRIGGVLLIWLGCSLTFYVTIWRRAAGRYVSRRQLDHGWVYSNGDY